MNKNRISKSIGGLRIAMQALAERRGIMLNIGGSNAFTDGRNITIPSLPEDDEEAMVLARGYIDHEAAHIALTDFGIEVGGNCWLNLLEDVRIERQQGEKYPGVVINTAKLLEAVVKQGGFPITDHLIGNLQVWAAARARTRILRQQALAKREIVIEASCRTAFGDTFCDEFAAIVDTVKDCRSTLDCRDVAEKLKQLVASPPPLPSSSKKPEDKKEDKDEVGDGEPSESQSDKDGKNKNEDADKEPSQSMSDKAEDRNSEVDGDGEPSESQSENNDMDKDKDGDEESSQSTFDSDKDEDGNEGGDDGKGDASPSGSDIRQQLKNLQGLADTPPPDEDVTDLGAMLKDALEEKLVKEIAEKGDDAVAYVPKTTKQSLPNLYHQRGMFEAFKALLAQESRKTAKMKTQLSGLFQAIGLKQKYPSMVGSRIDSRSIHLVGTQTPDNRVFLTRREREKVNTAIALLVDRSGSMKEDISLAVQSAYVTSRSLESLPGITHCIGLFPGEDRNTYSDILLAKEFEERCRPEQFFNINADGGTPMAEAALWAGMMLTHRLETRRIAILFTDGDPNDDDQAKKAVALLRLHGIELYVVLLSDSGHALEYTSSWIDNESVTIISKIEQLPNALHGLLKYTLLKKRRAA
ncbi:MAG: hypothetical protein M0P16_00370 [Syntrophales bacterium]|jgi:hypothetical protein|nr:hypothetical protein [Syntrophales bacterium]